LELIQVAIEAPHVLAHVYAGEPLEVVELVAGPTKVALGIAGVVGVLRVTDLVAGGLALPLGARFGRTTREGESGDAGESDERNDPDLHTATTTSKSLRMWKLVTICAMPRMIAPMPIHTMRRAAERPG